MKDWNPVLDVLRIACYALLGYVVFGGALVFIAATHLH